MTLCDFFRVLSLSLLLILNLAVGCVRVSLFFFLSPQLLIDSFMMYWECGCMCEGDPELVMEYARSSVVTI